ncbi:hypothetical protein ACFS5M_09210 [Lacinutrix iliipiscaria]|uniref:Uncharacterized protein n=1 Tax=Lacinutrix iliipiscaria TaxID=1230532 RepID=A0ABW5WNK3_9FLAO
MNTLKQHISEAYLFIAIIYYWSLTSIAINWYAITLLIILGLLIITKNKILGMTIGIILILINFYLFLALASELFEFKTFNSNAKQLLGFGVLFLGLNLLFSTILLYKYAKAPSIKRINILNKSDL